MSMQSKQTANVDVNTANVNAATGFGERGYNSTVLYYLYMAINKLLNI